MKIDEIPKNGLLILTVYFSGYKDSYQNDARRFLSINFPKKKRIKKLKLTPLEFSIVGMISGGISRGLGVTYQFSYNNMTPEAFKALEEQLKEESDTKNWWGTHDSLIAEMQVPNEIPKNGLIILNTYFNDYKDTNRESIKSFPIDLSKTDPGMTINLTPLEFSIVRLISGGVSRPVGVTYQFSYNNMTPEAFKALEEQLKEESSNKKNWLDRYEILIADYIGDY